MKEFSKKDLRKAKKIIRQEIIQDIIVEILKINQKKYIQDFLESKKITSYCPTIFSVKARSSLFLD